MLLATVLLAGSSANASIVIDNFSDLTDVDPGNSATTSTGIYGTRTITSTGGAAAFDAIAAGRFDASTGGGGILTFDYVLTAPIDLHSSGNFPGSPLVLDLFDAVVSSMDMTITYFSGGASAEFSRSISNVNQTAGGIGIHGTDFGDGAIASAVDRILISFADQPGGLPFAQFGSGGGTSSIAAVPEPTTMALLTPLMLGGVFYRRRKTKEADQAKI